MSTVGMIVFLLLCLAFLSIAGTTLAMVARGKLWKTKPREVDDEPREEDQA